MQINIKKLKEKGITVRLVDEFGSVLTKTQIATVEVFPENGKPFPKEIGDAIHQMLHTTEYADATTEGLIRRVQTLQVLEAIESTED